MKFEKSREVVQVRFSESYLYWDRTGFITNSLRNTFPSLSVSRAGADETILESPEIGVHLSYSPSALSVTYWPLRGKKDRMEEFTSTLHALVFSTIEPKVIQRAGCRFFYDAEVGSLVEGKQFVASKGGEFGMSPAPSQWKNDETLSKLLPCRYNVSLESENFGVRISLSPAEISLNIGAEVQRVLKSYVEPKPLVRLDVDVYSNATMAFESLDIGSLLKSNRKMVETMILPSYNR